MEFGFSIGRVKGVEDRDRVGFRLRPVSQASGVVGISLKLYIVLHSFSSDSLLI